MTANIGEVATSEGSSSVRYYVKDRLVLALVELIVGQVARIKASVMSHD